jgi:hypothetical protein
MQNIQVLLRLPADVVGHPILNKASDLGACVLPVLVADPFLEVLHFLKEHLKEGQ